MLYNTLQASQAILVSIADLREIPEDRLPIKLNPDAKQEYHDRLYHRDDIIAYVKNNHDNHWVKRANNLLNRFEPVNADELA